MTTANCGIGCAIEELVSGSPARDRSSQHLGRHRWVIERTIAWLGGYHRLSIRYDCKGTHYCGFLTLAAALTCYKKLYMARNAT
ncbi:transposase [Nocardia sp. NPDC127606]|uniref:transposase n=1 Tax=Nocardia sp. NPDC127606 TaxID=3345406 RepID=UPI00363EB57E